MINCEYINGVSGVKCMVYECNSITNEHKERFCHDMTDEKFLPGTNIRRAQCIIKGKLDELIELKGLKK